jgi:drug/metabolite transporter (DMT)-like permease
MRTFTIEIWIPITLVAAFLQNLRSLLQRRLTGELSVNGAAYVRFCYAVPFAWLYMLVLWQGEPRGFNVAFFGYALTGGLAQIIATSALLASFTQGKFAVGTAFSKTETAQAAMFGLLVLGDAIDVWGVGGIGVSLLGVFLLSGHYRSDELFRPSRVMLMGIVAGAGFAASAVCFRGASLSLDVGTVVERASLTVVTTVTLQTLIMGTFLHFREPGQLQRVARSWRAAVWIGAIGAVASVGWFTAMTLTNAAVVRAVGQVELLFAVLTSVLFFGEHLGPRELLGIALLVAGILLLI